ncbi:hypothetical protein BT67DRAFT_306530 [Trichocladium antarcticum]|uniref:Uncharacterized protein n=1 Tax=Trichocladium antarcticum TaxID=1450529 RepID=A0AAN6UJU5_9PEZI|nr:hypothetical protein BT67DRAFT_306530 [Trichocladium antarcticum]
MFLSTGSSWFGGWGGIPVVHGGLSDIPWLRFAARIKQSPPNGAAVVGLSRRQWGAGDSNTAMGRFGLLILHPDRPKYGCRCRFDVELTRCASKNHLRSTQDGLGIGRCIARDQPLPTPRHIITAELRVCYGRRHFYQYLSSRHALVLSRLVAGHDPKTYISVWFGRSCKCLPDPLHEAKLPPCQPPGAKPTTRPPTPTR